jgi:hypothetical protein
MNPTTSPSDPSSHQDSLPGPLPKSHFQTQSPQLGGRSFLVILFLLCSLPVAVVALIWQYLPRVEEGKLDARVTAIGLPSVEYYQIDYRRRDPHSGGELLVTNTGTQAWTHLNISINTFYQIYDTVPIAPGETVRFELDRFVSRTGARFSLQYNELRNVRVYARLPTKNRATYKYEFPTVAKGTRNSSENLLPTGSE